MSESKVIRVSNDVYLRILLLHKGEQDTPDYVLRRILHLPRAENEPVWGEEEDEQNQQSA